MARKKHDEDDAAAVAEPTPLGNVGIGAILERAGISVASAKAKVSAMHATFAGDIPDGARRRLVNELFPANVRDKILLGIIDEWARG